MPAQMAGLLLALPDLLALDLPALVSAAGYPGTRDIPLLRSRLSAGARPGQGQALRAARGRP